jgi:hypothetical protein
MQNDELLKLLDGPLNNDPWPTAPHESNPHYFRTWQHVSVALQRGLRQWVPEFYFRDLRRLEDRDAGYAMVIYSACRLFYGRPRTEFTYDIADDTTLPAAVRAIGCGTERTLAALTARLEAAGCHEMGRQYSPVWYQDVLAAVKKRPHGLIALLAREAKVIDAVIDFATQRGVAAAQRFARRSSSALRNLLGVDMRELLPRVLNEVTVVLGEERRGFAGSMAVEVRAGGLLRAVPAWGMDPCPDGRGSSGLENRGAVLAL